jgi:hypothetical protein
MNSLINLVNNKYIETKRQTYTQKDIDDIYSLMKFLNEDEINKYEMERRNSKNKPFYDECLEERTITFKDIFTEKDENDIISLYVNDDGKKEYLLNFDINRYQDITIKYERIPVFVSFFNDEPNGNLKCYIQYDMMVCLSRKDIFNIKKMIEAMLYDIEDYSKFYFNFLLDEKIKELNRDYEFEDGLMEDREMEEEFIQKDLEIEEMRNNEDNLSDSEYNYY